MRVWFRTFALAALCTLAWPFARAAEFTVRVGEYYFNPPIVTVSPGDTVTWLNEGFQPHDSTAIGGAWASPSLFSEETFSFTFTSPGEFPYVCVRHIANFPQQTGLVMVASANLPPSVRITSPTAGAAFLAPATFTITADATDTDGSVANVQFLVNGSSAGNSSGPIFSTTVSALPAGIYSLTAIATDNQGATATSQPVSISVTNPPITYPLAISAQPLNGGSVTGNAPGNYAAGTMITLTAVAADGFAFAGWSGDATGAENPLTFTMDGPRNVVANFTPVTVPTYTLTLLADPAQGGRIEATPAPNGPSNTYLQGTVVSLRAIPALAAGSTFRFTNWTGDVTGTNNPASITITTNALVTAHFVESLRSTFRLTLATNPPEAGIIQVSPAPDAPGGLYFDGAVVTVTATAVRTNVFSHWSGASSSTAAVISQVMDSDKALTANFVPFVSAQHSLTLVVSPPGSGSILVTPPPGSNGLYAAGTTIALAAHPNAGFRFADWSGTVSSTNNPVLLVINGDSSVTATFTPETPVDFLELAGVYRGLVLDESTTNFPALAYAASGAINLRVSRTGAYRGAASIGGMREFIAGQFDRFGYAPVIMRRATLIGSLQIKDAGLRMNGVLTDGRKTSTLLLYRAVAPTNVAEFTGAYALVLDPAGPVGNPGGVTMRVMSNGSVRLRGVLGDGTEVIDQTFIAPDGVIPLFAPLYGRRGVMMGWLNLTENGVAQGSVRWFRPGNSRNVNYPTGFGLVVPVTGSRSY